jgi:ABC-type transport system involved in cytochrome bd biosynthesis fused ATPase/permease subunit
VLEEQGVKERRLSAHRRGKRPPVYPPDRGLCFPRVTCNRRYNARVTGRAEMENRPLTRRVLQPVSAGLVALALRAELNWLQKTMTGLFLSASLLLPTLTSAIPLRAYQQARNDPAKQSQIFKDSFTTAIAKTVTALRSTHFRDGKEKSQQRIEREQDRANRVEKVVATMTDDQAAALVKLIAQYAEAKPDMELEDVISGFLLLEADKLADPPSGDVRAPH